MLRGFRHPCCRPDGRGPYFEAHQGDEQKAILHYQCNIELSEAFCSSISVFEVALRNALNKELVAMAGREDWYAILPTTLGLTGLNRYVTQANKQIAGRREITTPSKIVAELTLGFWVSLLNAEYERLLWKDLRKAFPFIPKSQRQRKNISAPLNSFRTFRNRVFHHESICWNANKLREIHDEIRRVMSWIDKDISAWLEEFDRFEVVLESVEKRLGWRTLA